MAQALATLITGSMRSGLDQSKLFKLLRGMAIDNARTKFSALDITKQTDNTTGTAATSIAAVVNPVVHITTGSATAAPKAGFDTAIGKLANCAGSYANMLNYYLAELGLPVVTVPSTITITAALPALDKTLSGVTTTGGLSPATGLAQIAVAKNNLATLIKATNDLRVALGYGVLTDASGGIASNTRTLVDDTATAASVDASAVNSLSDASVDAALGKLADNYASLSLLTNRVIDPDETINLTDSSGGTASSAVPPAIVASATPAAFTTVGTDCAPKAGFDTAIDVIENNLAELANKANFLIDYYDLSASIARLTDSTGQTTNGTLESQSVNLTAVTGTTVCVDVVSATTAINAINNSSKTLASVVNLISDYYGLVRFNVSAATGTASTTNTIVNVPATGTGVSGASLSTMSDTDVDAWLVAVRNNLSTLAARLNAMDNIGSSRPLMVVASV